MSNSKTLQEYDQQTALCRELFVKKAHDYGTAWRVLRPASLTDQIFIKVSRIRTLQTTGNAKIDEGQRAEFIGVVNYAAMALIQTEKGYSDWADISPDDAIKAYDDKIAQAKNLMCLKNHDYDEAWRRMRVESITDIIMMKILRTKEIEDNNGNTLVSEGVDANYLDMINYSIFALIKTA